MGFVQVWLDVATINISNITAFVRAEQTSLNISSKYLSLSNAGQRLRADCYGKNKSIFLTFYAAILVLST